jgi:hypothetical protein
MVVSLAIGSGSVTVGLVILKRVCQHLGSLLEMLSGSDLSGKKYSGFVTFHIL